MLMGGLLGSSYSKSLVRREEVLSSERGPLTVTVAIAVKNAVSSINRTLDSVLEQSYVHKTVLVVDGASSDGTLELIRRYSSSILETVTEPDAGVYDGMNKAVRLAHGDYTLFMNAGDEFNSRVSLEEAACAIASTMPDIAIGRYLYLDAGFTALVEPLTMEDRISLLKRRRVRAALSRPICHQATLTRTAFLRSMGGYDTNFRLLADQEFLFRSHDTGATFQYLDVVICRYRFGGLSSDAITSSAEFLELLSNRGYDSRLLRRTLSGGFHAKVKTAARSIIQSVPFLGRLLALRRVSSLRNTRKR